MVFCHSALIFIWIKQKKRLYLRPISGCSAARLAHLLWEQGVPGSNPGTPTKSNRARRCRKTSFCFYALVQVYLQYKGMENKSRLRSNLLAELGFKCPCGKQNRKGVKRSRQSLRSSQSWYPDKKKRAAEFLLCCFCLVLVIGC